MTEVRHPEKIYRTSNPIPKKPDMFQSSWKGYRISTPADMEESVSTKNRIP